MAPNDLAVAVWPHPETFRYVLIRPLAALAVGLAFRTRHDWLECLLNVWIAMDA